MRLRYWTALTVIVGVAVGMTLRGDRQAQAPAALTGTTSAVLQGQEEPLAIDAENQEDLSASKAALTDWSPDPDLPDDEAPTWSRAVGPGESLNVLLAEAGLDAGARAEVAQAIGSEYDLQRLQPGHRLALLLAADGAPEKAILEVENGVRVKAVFGAAPSVRVVPPRLDTLRRAGEAEIGSSIYAALDGAGIPTRFAIDLDLVLAGTLDLRRELSGGEHLRLLWRENLLGERTIGEPTIDFAELDLGDARYEVLWADDDSRRTRIYKDGLLLRTLVQPIRGARLSSAFGMRKHPVHGIVRMHSGVDFAAEQGSGVFATQDGNVVFMGRRSGYGLMVEIEHADDLSTVYAHLISVRETLEIGQRVAAGDNIGSVGSTGTSTGPHLHYELRVDGRPVQPLTDDRLFKQGKETPGSRDGPGLIDTARDDLSRLLATGQ